MRRPWKIVATVLFVLSLLVGGLLGDRLLALTDETREFLRLYTEVVSVAHDRYGAEVTYRDIVFASIQGLLRTLDPHSSFLTPQAYASMRERQQSSFYGLGILVSTRNGQLTVIAPLEGTPAWRLGIRAGDVINTIEGEPTAAMTLDEAVQKLKGPKGTQVRITIVRRGIDEPLELTVTRDEIPQTTVRYAYLLTPETGYIRITDFNRATGKEVAKAIADLKDQGMKQLLVDLRDNGGGLLDQAIEVAEQFIPKGAKIVETRGRTRDSYQAYHAQGGQSALQVPVVVLVSRGTASAAEILAGAIQDHDIGLIVGTPTWGKGLVQTVFNLSYGAGLALTTAKYYTPSGRLIQRDYSSFFDYYAYSNGNGAVSGGEPEDPEPPAEERDVFLTDLGRKVYGGGGITPDVVVEPEEISPFLQYLHTRHAFANFAAELHNRAPIKSQTWKPGSETLQAFRRWLIQESLAGAEEIDEAFADPETAAYILRHIRAEAFNTAFGQEAWHKILAAGDNQIQAALDLFDRAADLLAQRQGLEPQKARRAEATPRS